MKTLLAVFGLFILFSVAGCAQKPKYVELKKESIAKLNCSKVKEICISTHSYKKKGLSYSYDFFITNPEKIKIIIESIQEAGSIEDYYVNILWPWLDVKGYVRHPNENELTLRKSRRHIIFETKEIKYETQIAWDEKTVYGIWWQSSKLMNHFQKWNLPENLANADPNWPAPDWITNPPPESSPNFPPANLPQLDSMSISNQ